MTPIATLPSSGVWAVSDKLTRHARRFQLPPELRLRDTQAGKHLKLMKVRDTVGKHGLHGNRTISASGTLFLTNALVSHVRERGALSGLCGTKSTQSKSHVAPQK
jgi:hypothetical protein